MSGLAGWVDFERDLNTQRPVVEAMTAALRHRGPDSSGVWTSTQAALGQCRLNVLDPAAGSRFHQPERPATGASGCTIAFAGRIYNAPEVRRELDRLPGPGRAGSDPELALLAFEQWGHDFVQHLNGAFAFALWDQADRRLLLGRDRLGVKPLYYYPVPQGLLFASEPKGIMANPLFEARLDYSALPILLQPRLTLAGQTPLSGLHELPPAHLASFSPAGLSVRPYWQLTSEPHEASFEDTAWQLRSLLEDIVAQQVPDSTSGAAMLSGGVDSTSVAALGSAVLRKQDPQSLLDTYCLVFESDAEHFVSTELRPDVDAPYAAAAAEFIGTRHHTITATLQDLLDAIPATRRARDLPGWGQFDASMYLLFQQIRKDRPVALTGEAADEFLGGYPYFFKPELAGRQGFPWLGDGPQLSHYLAPDLLRLVNPQEDERARYHQLISQVPVLPGEDPDNARMREVFYLGMAGPLAVILDRKERMSMAAGLEVRIPFCDHRLVQLLWNVPWSMKSQGGVKGLLKAAMADLLPPATLNRKKSAYPHVQNPHYDRDLIDQADRLVNDRHSPVGGLFDATRFNQLLGQIRAGQLAAALPGGTNGAQLLIQLVELNTWIKDYHVSLG